jgi:hypothetical protein
LTPSSPENETAGHEQGWIGTRSRQLHALRRPWSITVAVGSGSDANRFVGILHGCPRHRTVYREHTAWPNRAQIRGLMGVVT